MFIVIIPIITIMIVITITNAGGKKYVEENGNSDILEHTSCISCHIFNPFREGRENDGILPYMYVHMCYLLRPPFFQALLSVTIFDFFRHC